MYIAWWKFYKEFLVFSNFTEFRRGVCKAQQVKALVIYTDRLSSIPRTYREGGRLIPVSYPLPFTKSTITFEILDFQIRDAQNIEKERWNCQLDGSTRWVLNIISFHVTTPNWVLFFLAETDNGTDYRYFYTAWYPDLTVHRNQKAAAKRPQDAPGQECST